MKIKVIRKIQDSNKPKALDYQKEASMAPDRVRNKWYSIVHIYEDMDSAGVPKHVKLISSFIDGEIGKVNKDQIINAMSIVEGELKEHYQPDSSYDPEDSDWIQHDRFQDDMYIVKQYIESALKNKASDSVGSFYINGKLVASARYDKDSYVFFDVNGNVVSKIKSEELSLPKDKAKAWEKLTSTFGDLRDATPQPTEPSQPTQSTSATSKITRARDRAVDEKKVDEKKVDELVSLILKNGIDRVTKIYLPIFIDKSIEGQDPKSDKVKVLNNLKRYINDTDFKKLLSEHDKSTLTKALRYLDITYIDTLIRYLIINQEQRQKALAR